MKRAIEKLIEEFAEYLIYGEENLKKQYQAQRIERKQSIKDASKSSIEAVYRQFSKLQNITYWGNNHKENYYEQAKYIENVEDAYQTTMKTYKEEYYYYNDGSYPRFTLHNFRLYITWRTKVRKGIVEPSNDVFPKLYINETLNLIHCKNEEEALEKLLAFWEAYRAFDTTMDYKFKSMIKEFYVLSSIETPFVEIEKRFPCPKDANREIIGEILEGNYAHKMLWMQNVSNYKIGNSKFLETPYGYMLEACLEQVLERAHKEIAKVHLSLPKLLVKKQMVQGYWIEPLSSYCVYREEQKEIEKQIHAMETYAYKKGVWKKRMYVVNEVYKPFIAYLVKNMECYIRKYVGYRPLKKMEKKEFLKYCDTYYYTPQQESNMYKLYGIDWDTILKETVIQYLKTTNVPRDVCKTKKKEVELPKEEPVKVEFHIEAFETIREKAEQTQKSLIIEEDEVPKEVVAKPVVEEQPQIEKSYENVYVQFVESLNTGEKEVIEQMIAKKPMEHTIEKVAAAYCIMPEMLLSQMNDKALETIGDTIIDSNTKGIYEEYEAEIKQILD